MEKKEYCPLAIVISIAAICESGHHCLSRVSCGHALSANKCWHRPSSVCGNLWCVYDTANKANKMKKMMCV